MKVTGTNKLSSSAPLADFVAVRGCYSCKRYTECGYGYSCNIGYTRTHLNRHSIYSSFSAGEVENCAKHDEEERYKNKKPA